MQLLLNPVVKFEEIKNAIEAGNTGSIVDMFVKCGVTVSKLNNKSIKEKIKGDKWKEWSSRSEEGKIWNWMWFENNACAKFEQ